MRSGGGTPDRAPRRAAVAASRWGPPGTAAELRVLGHPLFSRYPGGVATGQVRASVPSNRRATRVGATFFTERWNGSAWVRDSRSGSPHPNGRPIYPGQSFTFPSWG